MTWNYDIRLSKNDDVVGSAEGETHHNSREKWPKRKGKLIAQIFLLVSYMRILSVLHIKLFKHEAEGYMFRKIRITITLIVLVSAIAACSFGGGSSSIEVQSSISCSSATGQNTTCTVTLTNSSSSTGNFDWTASSSPSGAQFNSSSGSVAPGASSDQIQVTVPAGICPFTLTFADSNGTSVSSDQTSC